jgi:hypothetical protein
MRQSSSPALNHVQRGRQDAYEHWPLSDFEHTSDSSASLFRGPADERVAILSTTKFQEPVGPDEYSPDGRMLKSCGEPRLAVLLDKNWTACHRNFVDTVLTQKQRSQGTLFVVAVFL